MEQAMLQMLVLLALGTHYQCASGFPVYDFDPSSLQEALKASVAKVNSQSLSPYLFQATRNSLKRVNVLDEDTVVMNLEFNVQETTCLRDSGNPSSCTFRRGYYVPTAACRSTVQMSKGQVQNVWTHCRWASASESNSSEEPTAACRSTVQMSKGQVQDVWTHCRWASASESNSSEERMREEDVFLHIEGSKTSVKEQE
ncbi:Secreted phosphoprotein 24 [Microtus ochrogaster]|uniref:Secreted phosphoprotein 24 n=1 Tax=Microtus ochrogaster TaxID=79684 RepID=A0A8J6GDU8_MICOH|nr:Secreted phosphoprotein 24 [Microtus ochrogaster]